MNTQQQTLSLGIEPNGTLHGSALFLITLSNENITVHITNLGCTVMSIYTPDRNGAVKNIAAGFAQASEYAHNPWYFGCIVGRYANRIAGGRFTLDGKSYQLPVNNGENHLHGGIEGFDKKVWTIKAQIREEAHTGIVFEYISKDGEEGYPGNLTATVKYLLTRDNQLTISYTAITDQRTPVNFTNHSYFNLTGFEQPTIKDHLLQVNAAAYTEKSATNVPTGRILPVQGTGADFIQPARIGDRLDAFPSDMGFDLNYVLNHNDPTVPAAMLEDAHTGRWLKVFTDQPGIQVYTANYWDGSITGQQGEPYIKHGGIALETQAFPDSPNHPDFPNTILDPGQVYQTRTVYEFGVR